MSNRTAGNFGLLILRIGIGGVFLLFGIDKLQAPSNWIIYLPSQLGQFIQSSGFLTVIQFLRIQGFVEAALGVQILLGCMTRWSAAASSLALAAIVYCIGLDQIGIRDTGLLSAALAIAILGPGDWSVDAWLSRRDVK